MHRPFIVLDFETTGLTPAEGARATEVAAVLVQDGEIAGQFQSLMNAGVSIPPFIQALTGITNRMLATAPPCAEVMHAFSAFIGDTPLVAHNASFDKKFLDAELGRIGKKAGQPIACSMRIARRIYQKAPNHQLGTLVRYAHIKTDGIFHRALADSQMAAGLMLKMAEELRRNHDMPDVDFELMHKIQSMVIRDMPAQLRKLRETLRADTKI
jgi:DNA polymerase-3 subunit epsilon